MIPANKALRLVYTNYKGITAVRRVYPLAFYWGSTEYYRDKQWLMKVYDLDRKDTRFYSVKNIIDIIE